MIPYLQEPTLRIGPVTLHAFGAFVAAAVFVGCWLVLQRAEQQDRDRTTTTHLLLWVLGSGFLVSHLEYLVFSDSHVFVRPLAALSQPALLLNLWGGMSALGGMVGGVLGGVLFMRRKGWSRDEMLAQLEIIAFASPFAWSIARAGCALAHDHPGIHTMSWLAVRYPDGPRFDLGLLDFFCVLSLAGLFLFLDRLPRPRGFYFVLFLLLYGSERLLLDNLRDEERFLGLTSGQYGAGVAVLLGLFALSMLPASRSAAPATLCQMATVPSEPSQRPGEQAKHLIRRRS
jgi:phosphatidylglycerol:prolipoprotein diacylglycerol transferase